MKVRETLTKLHPTCHLRVQNSHGSSNAGLFYLIAPVWKPLYKCIDFIKLYVTIQFHYIYRCLSIQAVAIWGRIIVLSVWLPVFTRFTGRAMHVEFELSSSSASSWNGLAYWVFAVFCTLIFRPFLIGMWIHFSSSFSVIAASDMSSLNWSYSDSSSRLLHSSPHGHVDVSPSLRPFSKTSASKSQKTA